MLTLDEAAKKFRKSRRTINRWVAQSKLPVVRMSYQSVFVRPIDMEKAIEKRTVSGPAPKRMKKGKSK